MKLGALMGVLLCLAACKKDDSAAPEHKPPESIDKPKTDGGAAAAGQKPAAVTTAETLLTNLWKGDFAAARAMYDAAFQDSIKDEDLKKVVTVIGATGAPTSMTSVVLPAGNDWVRVEAAYPNNAVAIEYVRIVAGKPTNVMTRPLYTPPAYVDPSAVTVKPVTVGSGKTAHYGELLLPKTGTAPFPVIVMLQGSGGSDLDEWAAPVSVSPFRDIAYGVAAQGVAVLRFNKSAFAPDFLDAGFDAKTMTVKDEYFDPLDAALALLGKTAEVDPKRIYLLGHSEGGWLVPWMMKDRPTLAGAIIASGNARHFAAISVDQDQYLMPINHPGVTADQLAQLKKFDEAARDKALDPNLDDNTPTNQLPIGIAPAFWKSVVGYNAPHTLAAVQKPVLILQGDRDYNVTAKDDLPLWQDALKGRTDVTVKEYANLNHEYLTGTGMGTPSEIMQPGHVDKPVVDDIAAWVKAH